MRRLGWSAAKLRAWDRRGALRFVALQAPDADRLLGGMDDAERYAPWHLVMHDGRIYSAGAAIPQLLRLLSAGTPLAGLADAMPHTIERIYRLALRNRERLGRVLGAQACSVDPSRASRR